MISLQTLNPAANPTNAIAQASARTGVDFDYLLKTAQRESSLNSSAKAQTSSAAGLFQFIDQTWLGMIKNHGAKHGLQTQADQITQDKNGRYQIADPTDKSAILALRHDAEISSLMAAEYTQEASSVLEASLGREPNAGELYMAHFLGAGSATKLVTLAETSPATPAADAFPNAASANQSIFYHPNGDPRSVSEVVANLSAKHGGSGSEAPTSVPVMTAEYRVNDIQIPLPAKGRVQFVPNAPRSDLEFQPYPAQGVQLSPMMVQILASLDPLASTKSGRTI